jgi:hypothetical protein
MENEIDDDELAAMLAEDDQEEEKNEISTKNLSFVEQVDTMTHEQLVELTCSLADKSSPVKKSPIYKLSDVDIGELFESKTSK